MGGKVDCYVDCVSPYSYFAFEYLQKNREALRDYGVEVEFHPVLLGGIQKSSGNKPSWTLPARAEYLKFDRERAKQYFGMPKMRAPDVFPVSTVMAQRAQLYIKQKYSQSVYESVFKSLWVALWENNQDISKPAVLAEVWKEHFSPLQVEHISEATQDPTYKQMLNDKTKEALDKGSYGCPWFWVRNSEGKEERFFGSDRFTYMWQFLGIGWSDVSILPPKGQGNARL